MYVGAGTQLKFTPADDCGCAHALQQQELNPNGASNEDYQTADSEK